jgi:hypothetical protein
VSLEARSLGDAISKYADHLNRLLARTITQTRLVAFTAETSQPRRPTRMDLAFRRGGRVIQAPLSTRFGRIDLFIAQLCESIVTEARTHILRAVKYAYHLTPPGNQQPAVRWEYDGQPVDPSARWCRHHLQGPITLPIGDRRGLLLNDLHLPTGRVPIEEVVRFCIVDLEVKPLSRDWYEVLEESYATSSAHVVR